MVRISACHAGGRGFESRPHRKAAQKAAFLFMSYFVYILQSQKDHTFYIGFTSDVEKRLFYHNCGKSRYTSRKMPWVLVYTEMFATKSEAIKREKFLKKQRNKAFYEELIAGKK